MATVFNEPSLSFVVQKSDDSGRDLGVYIVDQAIDPRERNRSSLRVRNQMEQHLFHQWRKTGIHHAVIYEGNREMAEAIAKQAQECPF